MADRTHDDVDESTDGGPSLKRVMGPGLLLLFIVGDILGTGIYALTGDVAAEVGGVHGSRAAGTHRCDSDVDDPPSRVHWVATTRKIYFDEQPRMLRAHREFAESLRRGR